MSEPISELNELFYQENFIRTYKKGNIICSQGDDFSHVYLIKKGMVKNYDLDSNGSERTISIFGRNTIFPVIWLLAESPGRHLFYYEAFTDTECYVLESKSLREFLHKNPQLMMSVADKLAKAYLSVVGQVDMLEKSHIHERLEFVLYMLAVRVGTRDANLARIDTVVTQEDLANLAGVTRESMSLEINRSRAEGLFWKEGNFTYIDLDKLNTSSLPKYYAPELI